ncbi:MAG TPA: cysteine desulfurase [Candidatus Hydrogenedentes bacterium]|nr:cysteine desulfurase [Candidatus Hydrogenedentota bacterium]HQE83949.1 cysteine desulfurase [Candidatus Hydrogenedentota bacterium]HQH51795.1 cysteine desulfurase [Candidatus Hydrogenedentota bacterium]HQM48382.1 cysteine desulfurase [Candidatus Hydrogenedentota bacterium]
METVLKRAAGALPHNTPAFDVAAIRRDFPILHTTVHGKPLVYLDNAATSQKPQAVLDAISRYYSETNANIHRGLYHLSEEATKAYDDARHKVMAFLNARLKCEIVFTRGATESINLVAQTYGREHVKAGDEILITHMEHHSNIVPWQMLCREKGARLRVAPVTDTGELDMDAFRRMITDRTRLVALTYVSNALGTVNPVGELVRIAHGNGVRVLVDGAQAVPHLPIDLLDIGCDFFVCSGHKMFGPTGIGILYGRAELLEDMPPYQSGGDMILSVRFDETTFNSLPHKFEAGTPNIAGAIGLGAAIDYVNQLGMERIAAHEAGLLQYGTEVLRSVKGVRIIGNAAHKASVLSFVMDAAHPHDIGQILDEEGVAVRAGHHCAQPLMERFDVPATARASLAFYNTKEELDVFGKALERVNEVFG